jgi:hypothetical protein
MINKANTVKYKSKLIILNPLNHIILYIIKNLECVLQLFNARHDPIRNRAHPQLSSAFWGGKCSAQPPRNPGVLWFPRCISSFFWDPKKKGLLLGK